MPYLGSTPNASFSSRTKQDFTANGSTTDFTLSSAVASANDIEVFVGNVRQEPTDAYTVSGTTLTMSAAPANGINFYVVFKGLEENSVVPAAGTSVPGAFDVAGVLTTDGLTSDGNVSVVGQVGVGTSSHYDATTKLTVSGRINTTNGTVTGSMNYGGGTVVNIGSLSSHNIQLMTGNTTRVVIDTNGYVTMPNQPAFMAYKNGNQSLTAHTLTKITGWTEATDQSNSWDNGVGTFTAPSAGIYLFGIIMQANVNGGLHCMVRKNGNNGIYGDNYLDGGDISGGSYTVLMPMVANDYVEYLAYLTVNGNINSGRSKVWAVKVA